MRALVLVGSLLVAVGCDVVSGLSDFSVATSTPVAGGAGGEGGQGGTAGEGGQGGTAPPPPCVLSLSAFKHTTCAVMRDHSLSCWGLHGGLVMGSAMDVDIPVTATDRAYSQVAVGDGFIIALRQDGTVRTWGENTDGQLGIDETGSRQLTPQTPSVEDVVEVTAGRGHACVRETTGAVKCWGLNSHGQVGLDAAATNMPSPFLISSLSAKRIVAGARFTCAIRDDDAIVCWGRNTSGEIAVPSSPSEPPTASMIYADDLALGGAHVCIVRNGNVRCWGWNVHGQLGDASGTMDSTPRDVALDGVVEQVFASGRRSCVRLATGNVWCWGEAGLAVPMMNTPVNQRVPEIDGELGNAFPISVATYHTCAMRPDGTIWCRGRGGEGQLGNGFRTDSDTAVQAQLPCPDPP